MEPLSDEEKDLLLKAFSRCPFHVHLHLELEVLARGEVAVVARYHRDLDQGMGMLHGGVYAAALDTATYFAALSHYGVVSRRFPLTQEYKLNLIGSSRQEDIRATAHLIKAGRTVAVAEAKIHSASGKLCAAGMASFIVPAQ